MSRASLILRTPDDRRKAHLWIDKAPIGTIVEYRGAKRSLPQNDRLWAMLTELSEQLAWHGKKLKPDEWKSVMMAGLNKEMRLVPNMDGTGFVDLGHSTSKLTKPEFVELIELIYAFGAQHGVVFKEVKDG